MILVDHIRVALPCSETEWEASNSDQWQALRQHRVMEVEFPTAFNGLFSDSENSEEASIAFSPVGSHGLIHAMIQRVWFLHQAAKIPGQDNELRLNDVVQVEHALKRWRTGWEDHDETSATPLKGHGPMSFTSAALLRLAYIRINMNYGTVPRSMSSWSPERIARDFDSIPPIRRNVRATRAALHCAHGLSVIVKLGIEFFARTQSFFLSNQYALCSLESAIFLTKWLEAATGATPETPLTAEEKRLLDFVLQTIAETEYAEDSRALLTSSNRQGAIITRLWAKIFRADSIWEIVGLIGRSLSAYADLMEQR